MADVAYAVRPQDARRGTFLRASKREDGLRFFRWGFILAAAAILNPAASAAQAPKRASHTAATITATKISADAPKPPLSVRVVAYEINARLDPAKHTIIASEVLTYHNLTGQPQQTFP